MWRRRQMMISILFLGVWLSVSANPENSVATSEPTVSLADYLSMIELQNPALQRLALHRDAAQGKAVVAGALPDPNLSVGVYLQEVETRTGPQRARVSFSQRLPWKGKRRLQAEMANLEGDAIAAERVALRNRLFEAFIRDVAELTFLQESLSIREAHLKLLEDLRSVLELKYASGEADYASLVRLDVEMDRLRDRMAAERDFMKPLTANLNAVLGRKPDDALAVPSLPSLDDEVPFLENPSQGLNENPGLRAIEFRTRQARRAEERARLDRYPDFHVNLDWIETGSSVMPVQGSGDDPLILGIGINLPIWRKKIASAIRAARMEREALQHHSEDQHLQLGAAWRQARVAYDDQVRKIELYGQSLIPKARESLEVTQAAFEAGSAAYADVMDTEQTLLEFERTLLQAKADRLKYRATMERLSGGDFEFVEQTGGGT